MHVVVYVLRVGGEGFDWIHVLRDGRVRNEREAAAAVLLHASLVGLPIITRAEPHRLRLDRRSVLVRDDVFVVAVAAGVHRDGTHVDVEAVDNRLDAALLAPVDGVLDERHAGHRKLARPTARILARDHELDVLEGDLCVNKEFEYWQATIANPGTRTATGSNPRWADM